MRRLAMLLGVLGALVALSAQSDEVRPGYLELRQTTSDTYSLLFKIPSLGDDSRLAIYVDLPEGTNDVMPPRAVFHGGAYTERRTIRRNGGLAGQTIAIEGLSATSTDVLVRIESLGGATQTERLSPTKATFVVQAASGAGEVAATYLRLGIEHILFGFDHLLFVLALVILVRDWQRVALTVTAFTVAHTLTLTLSTLNLVTLSERLVEPMIAASICFVALQNVFWPRQANGWPRLAIAFAFGLFHGLGYAGGLKGAMTDLPTTAFVAALVGFTIGVELAHQLVIIPSYAVLSAARNIRSTESHTALTRQIMRYGSVAVSIGGAYYLIQALT